MGCCQEFILDFAREDRNSLHLSFLLCGVLLFVGPSVKGLLFAVSATEPSVVRRRANFSATGQTPSTPGAVVPQSDSQCTGCPARIPQQLPFDKLLVSLPVGTQTAMACEKPACLHLLKAILE